MHENVFNTLMKKLDDIIEGEDTKKIIMTEELVSSLSLDASIDFASAVVELKKAWKNAGRRGYTKLNTAFEIPIQLSEACIQQMNNMNLNQFSLGEDIRKSFHKNQTYKELVKELREKNINFSFQGIKTSTINGKIQFMELDFLFTINTFINLEWDNE